MFVESFRAVILFQFKTNVHIVQSYLQWSSAHQHWTSCTQCGLGVGMNNSTCTVSFGVFIDVKWDWISSLKEQTCVRLTMYVWVFVYVSVCVWLSVLDVLLMFVLFSGLFCMRWTLTPPHGRLFDRRSCWPWPNHTWAACRRSALLSMWTRAVW